jgi:hypothetical protein
VVSKSAGGRSSSPRLRLRGEDGERGAEEASVTAVSPEVLEELDALSSSLPHAERGELMVSRS